MAVQRPSLIKDQVETLQELYALELPRIMNLSKDMPFPERIKKVYAIGNGDSYHAALGATQAFAKWANVEYIPMPAYTFLKTEMNRIKKEQSEETLVVCISASGSSALCLKIMEELKSGGLAQTLALTGKADNAMDRAADWTLSTVISEKGRAPGIRTYAASFLGLVALAIRFNADSELAGHLAKAIAQSGDHIPQIIAESEKVASEAVQWDWPNAMVLGLDGLLGCASFVAAKFVEGSGILASFHELEEWCHVESMAYPLNSPVIILHGNDDTIDQVEKISSVARKAGRPVLIVSNLALDNLRDAANCFVSLHGVKHEELLPMYHYIPGVILVHSLAEKYGRAMFLSDLPFSLF